jgi:hypothetical protein
MATEPLLEVRSLSKICHVCWPRSASWVIQDLSHIAEGEF